MDTNICFVFFRVNEFHDIRLDDCTRHTCSVKNRNIGRIFSCRLNLRKQERDKIIYKRNKGDNGDNIEIHTGLGFFCSSAFSFVGAPDNRRHLFALCNTLHKMCNVFLSTRERFLADELLEVLTEQFR